MLSTYAEPHDLRLAQDKSSPATLMENEGVHAFQARPQSLAEHFGNIRSEGTMKQELIQGLPKLSLGAVCPPYPTRKYTNKEFGLQPMSPYPVESYWPVVAVFQLT